MRLLGVLAVATLVACGGTNDGSIDVTHDACAPLALVSTTPTDLQSAAMVDAQDLWKDHGAPSLGLRAGATVEVRFEEASPVFHGLYDDTTGIIYINNTITDQHVMSIVIAHELGHAFGLVHVPESERASLMNPGNLTTTPTLEDQHAVELLWGSCQ